MIYFSGKYLPSFIIVDFNKELSKYPSASNLPRNSLKNYLFLWTIPYAIYVVIGAISKGIM